MQYTSYMPCESGTQMIVWSNLNVLYTTPEGPFHNFQSWTQKWKIYIHTFYGISCNIKHITASSNLHFQQKK